MLVDERDGCRIEYNPLSGIYTAMFFSILITLANGPVACNYNRDCFIAAHFIDANILPRIVVAE